MTYSNFEKSCCSCGSSRSLTTNSMYAANTTGATLLVIISGTPVPLPSVQNLDSFRVNDTNTVFTVPATGRYFISYQVNTTVALLVGTEVLLNGTAIAGSIIHPVIATSQFSSNLIANLTIGDQVTLQLFGLVATAILLASPSTGAALTIIRVQ